MRHEQPTHMITRVIVIDGAFMSLWKLAMPSCEVEQPRKPVHGLSWAVMGLRRVPSYRSDRPINCVTACKDGCKGRDRSEASKGHKARAYI